MSPKTHSGLPASGSGLAFRFSRALVAFALWLAVVSFAPLSRAVTFTGNVTIAEGDTTYDGQDIIVDGATVTINGAHSFTSLSLINGAVLTHSPCTTTATHKLDINVTGAIAVDPTSRIDVTGKGYLSGRTTGNTTAGGSTEFSGASFGGMGGVYEVGRVNAVYGDYADPNDWGSGGGIGAGVPGSGGGLVRLVAVTLHLDGQVVASGGGGHAAGSGGGLYIRAGTIAGSGLIRVAGGNGGGKYGTGGGGRIALYAQDYSGFDLAKITAPGGTQGVFSGAGTVYIRDTDDPLGTMPFGN